MEVLHSTTKPGNENGNGAGRYEFEAFPDRTPDGKFGHAYFRIKRARANLAEAVVNGVQKAKGAIIWIRGQEDSRTEPVTPQAAPQGQKA